MPPAAHRSDVASFETTLDGGSRAREHDQMLTLAFTHARDMMLLARVEPGPEFRVQMVNERYLEGVRAAGLELSATQLLGVTFSQLREIFGIKPEAWQPLLDRYRTVLATRQTMNFDEVTETPRGVFYGRSTIAPLCNDRGDVQYVLYASTDHTQRRRAEIALHESEEKFAKAFRASPGAMALSEPGGRGFIEVNDGYVRMFGYSREELLGRSLDDLNLWGDEAERLRFVTAFRATGAVHEMEVVRRRKDGVLITCVLSAEALELDGRRCVVAALYDITSRRAAEQALRDSEAKFAQAFRASPGAMGISDLDTRRFVDVNDHYTRLLGYSREELIGRTAMEVGLWAREEDRDRFMAELLARGAIEEMEVVARHRDGRLVECLLRAEQVVLQGRTHVVTALFDVTARRRAEEAKAALEAQLRQTQKLDALGQLAGGIAHDFNNVLTGIMGATDLAMLDIDQPEELRKHLDTIRRASERAAKLVRQILTFSRKHAPDLRPLCLAEVTNEALQLLRSTLPKSIEIAQRFDSASPLTRADATQMHQVVMNLCTNAAHAMRKQGGRLEVMLAPAEFDEPMIGGTAGGSTLAGAREGVAGLAPGRYARLSISDTGEGMNAQTVARIFEPFFTTKAPGEGTGLGLSVVHSIVRDHAGVIAVRSVPGVGSRFDVYLPAHVPQSGVSQPESAAMPRGQGERLLLVDDEQMIASVTREVLTRLGYRVVMHTDSQAAWADFAARPNDFDLVMTDLRMPRMDGVELAQRITGMRPGIPLIVATGHGEGLTPERLREMGVAALLLKPLTFQKLAGALAAALGRNV